ncbi:MAG TPA: hypothetical protein VIT23_15340 [Terrimicrobiaceae bacterium]
MNRIKRIVYTVLILIAVTGVQGVHGLTFGERTLSLPAGSPGYIFNSLQGARKVRLTYGGRYSVRAVDRESDQWNSKEVEATLIVDVVKNGDAYSIGHCELLLAGKRADPASVRRHLAMLALSDAKSRSSSPVMIAKSTIHDISNVAQTVNYASMEGRCSVEIYGNDYLAAKLKTGVSVSFGGRSYQCRECYYYKEYQSGSSIWEATYFHDAIPGRIGRFFRNLQNTEAKSKKEAETEAFDFTLAKMEIIQ